METPEPALPRPALAGRKRRTCPQVQTELSEDTKALAEALVPQSAYDTEKALRSGRRDYHYKTTYGPRVVGAILGNIMRGMSRGAAADLAGLRPQVLYEWVSEHPDLAKALARAEAYLESDLITVIRGGFARNPRLALELLERRFPRNWAPQSRHEHSGMVAHGIMSGDFLQKLAMARMKFDAAQGNEVNQAPALSEGGIRARAQFKQHTANPLSSSTPMKRCLGLF